MSESWAPVKRLLEDGFVKGVYPGAAAGILVESRPPKIFVAGTTARGANGASVTAETVFDLASLTKVLCTTSVAARLLDRGEIELDAIVAETLSDLPWHPEFQEVTVRDLLAHQAGFAAWVDFSKKIDLQKAPPGSEAARSFILESIASSAPEYSLRGATLYSDLGFILLGEWLERTTGTVLWSLFEREVKKPLGTQGFTASPLRDRVSLSALAATEDIPWRNGVVQGNVHDNNAYLLGGFAGHAGLFGTVRDCMGVGATWRDACLADKPYLSKKTARLFSSRQITPKGDSRALGWDIPAEKGSSAGTRVSDQAIGHLGYTGTSIWIDIERRAVVALLTNRIHPDAKNEKIKLFRPQFHDLIWETLDR
ncbi:MAG TPA: serine hydrolase domain-containing protein [Bdellovibrionota bacterium]|nr:serine hydrolase domain-containing protein [Bdellovibrionota bacterium]